MPQTVDSGHLWDRLMKMAEIGEIAGNGCNRQALTDTDAQGRALFQSWCADLGLIVSHDAVGNMFARMGGADDTLAPLVIGSHLDTQPTGGRFDGVLGVLAGLEVIRVLKDRNIIPPRPIEIANWTNEEGARFAPAMMGSGVYAGVFDLKDVRSITDADGIRLGDELDRLGLSDGTNPQEKEIFAYLELHIEQGPVLEAENTSIGIVTGAQAIRWYDLTVTGEEAHAGPTPMGLRKDAMEAVPDIVSAILEIGQSSPEARATIGQFQAWPGSRNVIPNKLTIAVDLRHPVEAELTAMDGALRAELADISARFPGRDITLESFWHSPAIQFDVDLIDAVRNGAESHDLAHRDIISGAGHDALYVSRRAPTAMIFVPSRDGISHNPREFTSQEHCAAGANVLLNAVLQILNL